MQRQMTVQASTKRNPTVGGQRGVAVLEISSLMITPLDPVTIEILERMQLKGPIDILQCFTLGTHDIEEGDILVVDDEEYPIRGIAEWPQRRGDTVYHILVEDLK